MEPEASSRATVEPGASRAERGTSTAATSTAATLSSGGASGGGAPRGTDSSVAVASCDVLAPSGAKDACAS